MSQQQTLLRVQTNIPSTTITGTTTYEYLDLYDDIPIKINKSFAELQDIASRNSDYSVNLLLPGSKTNNRFFESFYDVDIDTFYFNPNNRVECKILIDSKPLFTGYLRLNKVNILNSKVEYDVTLYSEVGNLFGKMGNNQLKDLNFDDEEYTFNHTFNLSAIDSKLAQSNFFRNDGKPLTFFYPVLHNGYNYESVSGATLPDFTGATVSRRTRLYTPTFPISGWTSLSGATAAGVQEYRINSPTEALYDNQLKPALNVYSLIQLIFKTYGYTISGDFMNTPWMKSLYMYGYFSSEVTKFGQKIVAIESLPKEGVELIYSGSTVPGSQLKIFVCKRGTGIPCYSLDDINYGFANMIPYSEYGTIESGLSGKTMTAVDGFDFGFEVDGVPVAPLSSLRYAPEPVGASISFMDGDAVNFSIVIDPNLKQIDLISSIAKKFNLVFVPNPDVPKDIIIEPYDFYVGTGEIRDWTDKISYDNGITVEPALNYVESELILTDQEDSDEGNKEFKTRNNRIYGVSINPNPTDFKTEKKTIDTIFSPELVRQWDELGPNSGSLIGLPLGINYAASSEQSSSDNIVRWVYNGIKTKPKLFFWMMPVNPFIDSVGEVFDIGAYNTYTVKIMNSSGTTINSYNRLPSISHTMPIGLSDNLKINNDSFSILFNSEETIANSISLYNTYTENDAYNTFYKNRITNIYNPNTRFLTAKFNLSFADIANLRPNDIIKVKNQYFVVNKISEFNYTSSELTSVELIQFNVNPQTYPTRYFKYYYCENPSVCFTIRTDFENPNLRSTNFIWSLYYDNQVGSLTGSTTGFTSSLKVLNLAGNPIIGIQYIPYTMQEITEAEYNSSSCYDFSLDPVMRFVYESQVDGLSYTFSGFWENSAGTKTGVNVWESCSDFYNDATTYGIATGTTSTYGPPGYCFNQQTHSNGQIREVQLGRNGDVFVGGGFTAYNGTTLTTNKNNLIKIYNNSILNTGFTHTSLNTVNSIEIDPIDDKIYMGGFSGYLRLNTNGTTDATFNGGVSGVNGAVSDICQLLDTNNETLIAGFFTSYNGTPRVGLAQITSGGTLNTSFNSYFVTGATFSFTRHLSRYSNSSAYSGITAVAGAYSQYSGQSRNNIVLINSDGTLYTTFNPGTGFDNQTQQVHTYDDGTILVAGDFTSYNGVATSGLVKLNNNGTLVTSFTNNYTGYTSNFPNNTNVQSFGLQSDGKIIIAAYNFIDNINSIWRINSDGSFDYTFNVGHMNFAQPANGAENIAVLSDDSFYLGGSFTTYSVARQGDICDSQLVVTTVFDNGIGPSEYDGTYTRWSGNTYGYFTLPNLFSGNTTYSGEKYTIWVRQVGTRFYTLIWTDATPDGDMINWTFLQSNGSTPMQGATVIVYNQFNNYNIPINENGFVYPVGVFDSPLGRKISITYPENCTKTVNRLVKLDKNGNFINCG